MTTLIAPLTVKLSSLTQAEEDDLAVALAGIPEGASTIWNNTLYKKRFWNGSAFQNYDLALEFVDQTYKELVYTGDNLTQINIWQDDSMTLKLNQTDLTYDGNGVLTEKQVIRIIDNFTYTVLFIYDINGLLINTETTII